jgi:hypothetical protein
MGETIQYHVMQIDLNDDTDEIEVTKVRTFIDSGKTAEVFLELCKELKPEAKFYIEEEY